MSMAPRPFRLGVAAACAALVVVGAAGCAAKRRVPPNLGQGDAAKFLFERGTEDLKAKRWIRAREYFREILDSYPQSVYRPDAKLGLGDTYLGEDTAESLVLAANEFKEFLTFFPTHKRADYAQYKLALSHFAEMAKPERDQTETKDTIRELETFVERYPDSALMSEATKKLREARDRLSQHEYGVGFFYYRIKWYPGAIDRFEQVLKTDPRYTYRDAVYYYLGESLVSSNRKAEALPYYERLLTEFQSSEYLAKASARVEELKKAMAEAGAPPPAGTATVRKEGRRP
jgi:outer membrane protein assembly factor BamD